MYWLQKNVGKMQITEVSAAKKLEALRNEQEVIFAVTALSQRYN